MSKKRMGCIFAVCVVVAVLAIALLLSKEKSGAEIRGEDVEISDYNQPEEVARQGNIVGEGSHSAVEDTSEEMVLLPVDDRVKVIEELIEKKLPIVPNVRKTNQDRIANKSVEQMVAEVGDSWSFLTSSPGMAFDLKNPAFLYQSFRNNLRVKKLIQLGRQDPEYVGELVSKDLLRRMNEWMDTAQANIDQNNTGYLVTDKGKTDGSDVGRKYDEDTYAIDAEIFILANIEYSKSLDVLAEYCSWHLELVIRNMKIKLGDGTFEERPVANPPNAPNKKELDDNVLFAAISHLLVKSNDPKYANVKEYLITKYLKGSSPSVEVVTDSPEALWPNNDLLPAFAGIDMSSEPTMTLYFQNESIIGDMEKYEDVKLYVVSKLLAIYRNW